MKFQVTMKDPDVLCEAIDDAVNAEVGRLDLPKDEREAVAERRREKAREAVAPWFRYGEYLTVEIDTDTGTCVVVAK